MKIDTQNSGQTAKREVLSSDAVDEAIADAFSAHVGKGAGKMSVADFAAASGKSDSTVYDYRSGALTPGGTDLIFACWLLGPDFTNRIFAVVGMNGMHRIEGTAPGVLELAGDMNATSGTLLRAAGDGIIDHQEAADGANKLRATANKMLEQADQLEDVAKRGGSIPVIAARSK